MTREELLERWGGTAALAILADERDQREVAERECAVWRERALAAEARLATLHRSAVPEPTFVLGTNAGVAR